VSSWLLDLTPSRSPKIRRSPNTALCARFARSLDHTAAIDEAVPPNASRTLFARFRSHRSILSRRKCVRYAQKFEATSS